MVSRLMGMVVVAVGVAGALEAQSDVTRVLVRVTAHDAKIVGSGVGGARVSVRNLKTGEVLSEGVQEGSTGNTGKIMRDPRVRGATVFDTEGAAGYIAELHLSEPTVVEIGAEGPLNTPHAMQRATKTMLVVPGKDVLGEGIIIELLGFTVVLESPETTPAVGHPFEVRANVTMLCGCPTEPGGLWNADEFEIVARLVRHGVVMSEQVLAFTGTTNTYSNEMSVHESGTYELQVLAIDQSKGNFGMATRALIIP